MGFGLIARFLSQKRTLWYTIERKDIINSKTSGIMKPDKGMGGGIFFPETAKMPAFSADEVAALSNVILSNTRSGSIPEISNSNNLGFGYRSSKLLVSFHSTQPLYGNIWFIMKPIRQGYPCQNLIACTIRVVQSDGNQGVAMGACCQEKDT